MKEKIPPPGTREGRQDRRHSRAELPRHQGCPSEAAVASALLNEHLRHGVTDAIHTGSDSAPGDPIEASSAIPRLVR
jgi:hypothetical protein